MRHPGLGRQDYTDYCIGVLQEEQALISIKLRRLELRKEDLYQELDKINGVIDELDKQSIENFRELERLLRYKERNK